MASTATRISFLAARFATGVRCEVAHLTVSFLAVNPFDFFIFEVSATGRNQRLRSPFFNRRPLRRGRILLFGFRASTPVANFFSGASRRRKTWLFLRHTESCFRGHRVDLQEQKRVARNFFPVTRIRGGELVMSRLGPPRYRRSLACRPGTAVPARARAGS